MKNLLHLFLFFCIYANSQEIKYDENNKLPDFIIVDTKGSQSELFKKTVVWINRTYKNPDRVITAKTENELIKINGACVDCLVMNVLGKKYWNTLQYIITIEFKENKYKFELSSVTFENSDDLKDGNNILFKKNGQIKANFKNYPKSIEDTLNNVFNNLKQSIENSSEDW